MAPLPKASGVLDIFFSTEYEVKDASIGPAPGRTPSKHPSIVPRRAAGAAS